MLEDLWGSVTDVIGDGLSSMLESILNATIFKLFYYLERALCWVIGVLMELFEVFAGLEPVTYNGKSDYLINVFFSNKAINNIYWGMAIIGMILIFVFTLWAVVKKMFDLEGKQQQSLGQIIGSAVRSLFIIVGLTLVVSVVLSATGTLMRQIDYIFNNAYHLDQPEEREFSDEEYAAMGRVLATVGNYSMVPNSDNRYNLNLCFNDIRADMYYLQEQGVFEYSYYETDANGNRQESWQSVLSQIAKSTDLRQDVSIEVYHEGVAKSITAAMTYLQTSANPLPAQKGRNNYTVTERTPLDRMIFLLGTFRAAKNSAFNEHPAMDDALRGPYYFEKGRSIYDYDNVNSDFHIGFQTDYILVWFASIALIFNLVVIILNCVARIFNMLLLYIIAPPFVASAPLDNGGKFRQWTIAFTIQSLSVFGTVIAMQLMLIYLPIVASPELVLFKDRPLLNAIAQFMLIYGGSEAAKKAGSLVTGILADQAGMEAIRSGDMSGAAGRVLSKATSAVTGVAGAAAGVAGFVMSPVTNLAKRPFKAIGDAWRNLGTGGAQSRADKAVQDEIAKNKAIERFRNSGHPDAKYLGGSGGSAPGGNGSSGNSDAPPQSQSQPPQQSQNQPPQQQNPPSGDQNQPLRQPPPIPNRGGGGNAPKSFEAEDAQRHAPPQPGSRMADIRERAGFDEGPDGGQGAGRPGGPGRQGAGLPAQQGAGGPNAARPNAAMPGGQAPRPAGRAREMNATGNRPTLDRPPAAPQQNDAPAQRGNDLPPQQRQDGNPPEAGPQNGNVQVPRQPGAEAGLNGDPPGQEGNAQPLPQMADRLGNQGRARQNNGSNDPQGRQYQAPPQQPGQVNNQQAPRQSGYQAQRQTNVQYQAPPQQPRQVNGQQAPRQGGYQAQRQPNVQYQAPPQQNVQYQAQPNIQYQVPPQPPTRQNPASPGNLPGNARKN